MTARVGKKVMVGGVVLIILGVMGATAYHLTSKRQSERPVQPGPGPARPKTPIRLAAVSPFPDEDQKIYEAFARHLARSLVAAGIEVGEAKIARTLHQASTWLARNKTDLYFDTPFRCVKVVRLSNAEPFLTHYRHGETEDRAVVIARNDTGITHFEDLPGKRMAFGHRASTLSYLVPKALMSHVGLELIDGTDELGLEDPKRVSFGFSEDDETTVFWVLKNKVQAGALSLANFERFVGARKTEIRVLLKSLPVPGQYVLHRPGMPDTLVIAIQEAMLNMGESEDGRRAMQAFGGTTGFSLFADHRKAAFDQLDDLLPFVEDELGQ